MEREIFVSEIKNTELTLTAEALADLSSAIVALGETVKEKKDKILKKDTETSWNLKNKDIKISILQQSCSEVSANIDEMIKRLDRVMESNGTSNDYNK